MHRSVTLAGAAVPHVSDTLNPAEDPHGAGSTQYNTVAVAWSAVAVS